MLTFSVYVFELFHRVFYCYQCPYGDDRYVEGGFYIIQFKLIVIIVIVISVVLPILLPHIQHPNYALNYIQIEIILLILIDLLWFKLCQHK